MDLHLYLYPGGIGLMNRDWLPLIAALEAKKAGQAAAARLRALVSDDPAAADAYVEVPMERDQIAQLLGFVLDAFDRKATAAAEKVEALDRVVEAEIAKTDPEPAFS